MFSNNFSTHRLETRPRTTLHGLPRNDTTVSTLPLTHHFNSEFKASQTQLQLLDEKSEVDWV